MKRAALLFFILALILAACQKPEAPYLRVNPESLSFEANGGAQTIQVSANNVWTADISFPGASVTPSSGKGDATVTVRMPSSSSPEEQTGSVSFSGTGVSAKVGITQAAQSLILADGEISVPSSGGPVTVNISYNVNYKVTVDPDASYWIEFIETKAMSNGKLEFETAPNGSTSPRKGKVTISDVGGKAAPAVITFTQSGASSSFSLLDTRDICKIARDYQIKEVVFNVRSPRVTENKLERIDDRGPEIYYSVSHGSALNLYTAAAAYQASDYFYFFDVDETIDAGSFRTMEKIDLGNVDFSYNRSFYFMFASCTNLKSVSFGKQKIKPTGMLNMFRGCKSLEEIDLSVLDWSDVDNASGLFEDCISLKKVNLSGCDTHNVKDMGAMFKGCSSLEEIDLSDFDTSEVTDMSNMFSGCMSLKSLDLSSFNTAKVTRMESMFFNCISLTSLDLSNFDTSMLIFAGNMFNCCVSLTFLDISSFDLSYGLDFFNAMIQVGAEAEKCVIRCSYDTCMRCFSRTVSTGLIEIELTDAEGLYNSSSYAKDGQAVQIQKATAGKGIDLVFMCDGFSDRMIDNGEYDRLVQLCVDGLFSQEPFASYKEYFNIYEVYAVSKNESYFFDTAFSVGPIVGPTGSNCSYFDLNGDTDKVLEYAAKAFEPGHSLDNVAVCVFSNVPPAINSGKTYCYEFKEGDYGIGRSVSLISLDMDPKFATLAHVVLHECGGHGFAKLGDEFYYPLKGASAITQDTVNMLSDMYKSFGVQKNIDFTSDPSKVKWSKFIADSRYKSEGIDLYVGGLETFTQGVWHPTEDSVMNMVESHTNRFNAPSREAIYYRINKLAFGEDWEYDYEKFVEFDLSSK